MTFEAPTAQKSLVKDAQEVVRTCAGLNARALARAVTRYLDQRMQGTGLTLAQFGLMAQIAIAADDTIGAIAQQTGLDQSTLSRNLRLLEAAGLVEIAVVEKDMRRRAVWLTEAGATRLEAAIPVWRAAQDALAEHIDPAAVAGLAATATVLTGDASG